MWILRGPKTDRYGIKQRTDGIEPARLKRYTKRWELGETPYLSITWAEQSRKVLEERRSSQLDSAKKILSFSVE